MAKLLQTLIPILFILATTAQSQTTSFFFDYRNSSSDLIFESNAVYETRYWNHIRLTQAEKKAVGRVLYPQSIQFWKMDGQVDFETTFIFRITPTLNPQACAADGIAFFICPTGSSIPVGSTGGNFGVFASAKHSPVFAVEIDTFPNKWDPNYRHVGIDVGSRASANTTIVGDAVLGTDVSATIRYAAATQVISVVVSTETESFEVSLQYDLSGLLDEQVQVGLSASTGEQVSLHEIFAWNFTATMVDTGYPTKSRKQLIRQIV